MSEMSYDDCRLRMLRRGKWSHEENMFAKKLIVAFNEGLLQLPQGKTLRSYLADKLYCDPMRISKKFAGSTSLGRQCFHASEPTFKNAEKFAEFQVLMLFQCFYY